MLLPAVVCGRVVFSELMRLAENGTLLELDVSANPPAPKILQQLAPVSV